MITGTLFNRLFGTRYEVVVTPPAADPRAAERFIERLLDLHAGEWAQIELSASAARERLWIWDGAWEAAVAKGGYAMATRAIATAERRGASRTIAALAGGAAAGLQSAGGITEAQLAELYAPFAAAIPPESLVVPNTRLRAAS